MQALLIGVNHFIVSGLLFVFITHLQSVPVLTELQTLCFLGTTVDLNLVV